MKVETYTNLFVHRSDVYAEQFPDGHYQPVRRPLTSFEIEEHLAGHASYGVYVVDPVPWGGQEFGNSVRYVVFDLDTYDEAALEFLCRAVEELVEPLVPAGAGWEADNYSRKRDNRCLMLENSGGKGYHIWLFLSEPLPASQVRRWVEPVRAAYNTERARYNDAHHAHTPPYERCHPEWPELEIFPKQDTVPEGGFGNLVKLPLGVHARTGGKSQIVNVTGWGNSVDKTGRLDSSLVPESPAETRSNESGALTGEGDREAPFACIAKIIEDGAPQGIRDRAMFHLAHYAIGTGMPKAMALAWCMDVNEKFTPPLSAAEVVTKVNSAVGMEANHPSCGGDWLQGFCPGGGKCFAPWNRREAAHAGGNATGGNVPYYAMTPAEQQAYRQRLGFA